MEFPGEATVVTYTASVATLGPLTPVPGLGSSLCSGTAEVPLVQLCRSRKGCVMFLFFFFWLRPCLVEIAGLGTEPVPQQQSEPLQ